MRLMQLCVSQCSVVHICCSQFQSVTWLSSAMWFSDYLAMAKVFFFFFLFFLAHSHPFDLSGSLGGHEAVCDRVWMLYDWTIKTNTPPVCISECLSRYKPRFRLRGVLSLARCYPMDGDQSGCFLITKSSFYPGEWFYELKKKKCYPRKQNGHWTIPPPFFEGMVWLKEGHYMDFLSEVTNGFDMLIAMQ